MCSFGILTTHREPAWQSDPGSNPQAGRDSLCGSRNCGSSSSTHASDDTGTRRNTVSITWHNRYLQERYLGRMLGIDCARSLDGGQDMSAELMSRARILNDTQNIAALFVVAPGITPVSTLGLCGVAISSHRVAETMSDRITTLNAGQRFTANLITVRQ